jgi:hypothetical protein
MRKIIFSFLILCTSCFVFAYNPVANGNNIFEFTSPRLISSASSVAGGGLKGITSSSIVLNPALIAGEQRWTLDLDYSAFIGSGSSSSYGQGMQLGMIMPSRFGVGSVVLQGLFLDKTPQLNLGNVFTIHSAFAKDITDELYFGVGLYGGFGADWALAADIGFWYNIKQIKWLPFLKDARWAVSVTGLGKSYEKEILALNGETISDYPMPFTPRVGVAGNLFDVKNFSGGMSLDFAFPTFQNVVFNAGLEFMIADVIRISTGWKADLKEILAEKTALLPTAGISFKFNFSGSEDSFLAKKGWQKSEAEVATAYQYFKDDLHLASGGVTLKLGQKDTVAPEITLWEEN